MLNCDVLNCFKNAYFQIAIYYYYYKKCIVGPGGLQSGPNSIWAQGPCRGGLVSRTNDRWPGCQGERLRTILSSALLDFNGKTNVLVKAISKQPPVKDVSKNGAHREAGCKIGSRKMRPLRIKCTCQRSDPVNEKRRLDGVISIFATSRK